MLRLDLPIARMNTIKHQQVKRLEKLGIHTIEDLLRHFPSRYEDMGSLVSIGKTKDGEQATIIGRVTSFTSKRSWKRKLLISEAVVEDDTGYIRVVFFGQKYLEQTFQEGKRVRLSGKMEYKNGERIMTSPAFELASRVPTHTGRVIGIYPETFGITSKWLRWQIQLALSHITSLEDPIPQDILDRYHLPTLSKALKSIHFPTTLDHALVARKRFAFEDMFFFQLKATRTADAWKQSGAIPVPRPDNLSSLTSHLPFTLTPDQHTALEDIVDDMARSRPMNRLLNGDVGSGKTAVALMASLHVAQSHSQTAILAPTEVLASQHFDTARKLLADSGMSIALLTHSYRSLVHTSAGDEVQTLKRDALLRAVRSGMIHILIGTHAIIQKDIAFSRLALAIVDEQHRFGVRQRATLQKNLVQCHDGSDTTTAHLLSMTATPIPRTLSLTLFGNLDVSLLETMPKGRKPIITQVIAPHEREKVYTFIRKSQKEGRQCYIILPLVEESMAFEGTKAAIAEHKRLENEIFPDLHIGLLHGKMKAKEKESVMADFKQGKLDILVATAVVEVGVDVPNATVMVIEEAQRFGLSQLHQFRGRIGRGKHQSYCFLLSGDDVEGPSRRMKILEKNTNGFAIAEEDLKLRGPGEFFGSRQSGLPDIKGEHLFNIKLITFAKKEARSLLTSDPDLSLHPLLREKLTLFDEKVHQE